ncbi:MAG TPA: glycosyltransferase [Vicinamibacterales bacterium]|nr:glycosyltransferase [Vicinamibacterales bacterium]
MPERLPIGIIFRSFQPGGTERQMIELVGRLDRARWDVHVGCFHARGPWLDRVRDAAPVTEFQVDSLRGTAVLQQARAFARWCSERNLAVVHTTDMATNLFALPAAAYARVPVRIANRRDVNPGRAAHELIAQRIAYTFAHRIVANCDAAAERLRRERIPSKKIAVIPNGVDFDGGSARGPIGSVRRVVTVANLRREKGHDVLIDAAALVVRRFADARFDLIGGGSELASLQERVARLGISHAVSFLGHCEDIPSRLTESDLFVLPSRSEAFPNAVLEAMAAGLPIVASRIGGLVELIDDGRTGVLVPPGDAAALANAIGALMADAARAAELAAAGREAARRYSFARMVAAFDALYLREWTRRVMVAAVRPNAVAKT